MSIRSDSPKTGSAAASKLVRRRVPRQPRESFTAINAALRIWELNNGIVTSWGRRAGK